VGHGKSGFRRGINVYLYIVLYHDVMSCYLCLCFTIGTIKKINVPKYTLWLFITRSQAVARIADRSASQHLRGHVTSCD